MVQCPGQITTVTAFIVLFRSLGAMYKYYPASKAEKPPTLAHVKETWVLNDLSGSWVLNDLSGCGFIVAGVVLLMTAMRFSLKKGRSKIVNPEEADSVSTTNVEPPIAVILRTLDGSEMTIKVPANSTTLGKLKALIQQEKGELQDFNLCFDTKFLSDDSATLSALGVADKMVLSITRKLEVKWKSKPGHVVKGMFSSVAGGEESVSCTETHVGYKEIESVISSAKVRCEEEDWAGFVVKNSVTSILYNGTLVEWPMDRLNCEVYYLVEPFQESADSVRTAAEIWGSGVSSDNLYSEATYDLHYME